MKNKNAQAHYVAKGKLHQLERHCDFGTIVVCNTIPGSNINIKEIIGNYECSSLAGSLFDASGLLVGLHDPSLSANNKLIIN